MYLCASLAENGLTDLELVLPSPQEFKIRSTCLCHLPNLGVSKKQNSNQLEATSKTRRFLHFIATPTRLLSADLPMT